MINAIFNKAPGRRRSARFSQCRGAKPAVLGGKVRNIRQARFQLRVQIAGWLSNETWNSPKNDGLIE
jgi:hypothetical protein